MTGSFFLGMDVETSVLFMAQTGSSASRTEIGLPQPGHLDPTRSLQSARMCRGHGGGAQEDIWKQEEAFEGLRSLLGVVEMDDTGGQVGNGLAGLPTSRPAPRWMAREERPSIHGYETSGQE